MPLNNNPLEKHQQFFKEEIKAFHESPMVLQRPDVTRNFMMKGLKKFNELGLPTQKNEYWKYTDLRKNLAEEFRTLEPFEPSERLRKFFVEDGLNFLNGYICQMPSSIPDGLSVQSGISEEIIRERLENPEDSLDALNLSLMTDSLVIRVRTGVKIEKPLCLNFYYARRENGDSNTPIGSYPNIFIEVEDHAEVSIFERHISLDEHPLLTSANTQVRLSPGARVIYAKYIDQQSGNEHIGQLGVKQKRDSYFQSTVITRGGALARQSVSVDQVEPGAEAETNGLYFAKDNEHHDHRTTLRHLSAHGVSRQLYKGILQDKARSVFNGKIYIAQDAQQVDSSQMNNNLLLSKKAEADTKPELEVYADNVKAEHGATVGRLEESQLFYLMSRSIDKATATQMLTYGFIGDVLLRIGNREIMDSLTKAGNFL